MNFERIYKLMSILKKGLTKFTWICKPNLDSSLEFKTYHNLSKFPSLNRFKKDSNP
jgi:hypothetical protein